jgi:hypothetical protein
VHDADTVDEDRDNKGAEAASIVAAQDGRRLGLVLAITISALRHAQVHSTRHATSGIFLNKHLNNVHCHSTMSALYSTTTNPHSLILKRLHHILPHIPTSSCSPTTPQTDLTQYFLTTLSPHSASNQLKKHSTNIVTAKLSNHVFEHKNEHFHLLPSILSPHISYPLIAMSHSYQTLPHPANILPLHLP